MKKIVQINTQNMFCRTGLEFISWIWVSILPWWSSEQVTLSLSFSLCSHAITLMRSSSFQQLSSQTQSNTQSRMRFTVCIQGFRKQYIKSAKQSFSFLSKVVVCSASAPNLAVVSKAARMVQFNSYVANYKFFKKVEILLLP